SRTATALRHDPCILPIPAEFRREEGMRQSIVKMVLILAGAWGMTGCVGPQFQLSDIEKLKVGESKRSEGERLLGSPTSVPVYGEDGYLLVACPDGRLRHLHARESIAPDETLFLSRKSAPIPDTPWCYFTWPIFLSSYTDGLALVTRFDQNDVLTESSLTLSSFRGLDLILLLGGTGPGHYLDFPLTPETLASLKRIHARGIRVRVLQGGKVLGPERLPDR